MQTRERTLPQLLYIGNVACGNEEDAMGASRFCSFGIASLPKATPPRIGLVDPDRCWKVLLTVAIAIGLKGDGENDEMEACLIKAYLPFEVQA